MNPNWELNERNTVVVFGDFGNRTPSDEPGAEFPVRLDIVEDETPLLMIGPGGEEFDAVGQSWTTDSSPYDSGPVLVGAKLNKIDGAPMLLDRTGTEFEVEGGTLRIVGLSDLGKVEDPANGVHYDDCYAEDGDNYIDIILVGDEAAARSITDVEIRGLDRGYRAFYNPGGPGPEPTDGVVYSAPGPRDLEPVVIALDDPMRVSREAQTTSIPWALIGVTTAAVAGAAWLLIRRYRRRRVATG